MIVKAKWVPNTGSAISLIINSMEDKDFRKLYICHCLLNEFQKKHTATESMKYFVTYI